MLRAIETQYKGYRFRSRLEARWAVFFDALGVPWRYEHQGYDLDGLWYLPDFWLPESSWHFEIKGVYPGGPEGERDRQKVARLAGASQMPVFLVFDLPDAVGTLIVPEPKNASGVGWLLCIFGICQHCGRLAAVAVIPDMRAWWRNLCSYCGFELDNPKTVITESAQFQSACAAARSARFEHGEQP